MARASAMAPADFFTGLRKGVKAKLPQELRKFEVGRGHGRLTKLYYDGHAEFHYEVWHHTGDGRLEIGLHFEGSADANERALEYFRDRMVEVKARLPRAELEPWDRGWSRLYETLPAPQLNEQVLASAIQRLDEYITTLQPMLLVFLA